MKFANLITKGDKVKNYGDDMQVHAIKLLYEYMGINYSDVVRITINELFTYDGEEYLIVPINLPFLGRYPAISPKIIPVYLGISVLNSSVADSLKWKEYEPIGCRDQHTLEVARECGVQAYLNGCMTITLPKLVNRGKADKVYIIDVCDELLDKIPKELKESAIYKTQQVWGRIVTEEESLAAYAEYQQEARLVITSRLHCAVPCLAWGIPVILAMKSISHRMMWLHRLMPIYDEKSFDKIDWNPQPIDIEELKKLIKENAARRLRDTWDKYYSQYRISEIYEDSSIKDVVLDGLKEPIEYMRCDWTMKEGRYKYIIWCVVQTADNLYKYITEEYRNAELIGVIDVYKATDFHGIPTGNLELLENLDDDVTVFVATAAANLMAIQTFQRLGIKNYVICWNNGKYADEAAKRIELIEER